jgi:CRISPR system Cascade subunit CasC
MLIQIHILQNYAPANLNRDDTGAPKDAFFGGFRRGRISSQCLKRSIRRSSTFDEAFSKANLLGVRTRQLPKLINAELKKLSKDETVIKEISSRIPEIGRESTKRKEADDSSTEASENAETQETEEQVKQLIFIGQEELPRLAEKLLSIYNILGSKGWKNAKIDVITKDLGNLVPRSVDIAMFGRMTTSAAFENVDASVQVAHALSTNALSQEFDYFTAVDDLAGDAGAGMIGDVEFNSSTYYKYFNIHWEQLVKNLGGDKVIARQAVAAFIEAAATAQPSGKQNTFAAYNLPDLVLVEVSDRNLPVSYANAFIKPLRASGNQSLLELSAKSLAEYMEKISTAYNVETKRAAMTLLESQMPQTEMKPSLIDLQKWLIGCLPQGD